MSKSLIVVAVILLAILSLSSLYDLIQGTAQDFSGYTFLVAGGLALGLVPQLSKKERKTRTEKVVKNLVRKKVKKLKIKSKVEKETTSQEKAEEISEKEIKWIGQSGLEQIQSQE